MRGWYVSDPDPERRRCVLAFVDRAPADCERRERRLLSRPRFRAVSKLPGLSSLLHPVRCCSGLLTKLSLLLLRSFQGPDDGGASQPDAHDET